MKRAMRRKSICCLEIKRRTGCFSLCPTLEAAPDDALIFSQTPPFSYMNISKHRERIEKVFTVDNALKYVEFAIKSRKPILLQFEEIQAFADAMMLQRYTAVSGIWHTPFGNTNDHT